MLATDLAAPSQLLISGMSQEVITVYSEVIQTQEVILGFSYLTLWS